MINGGLKEPIARFLTMNEILSVGLELSIVFKWLVF